MTFEVNTSPFLGRDGKFVTSRQIRERLDRESIHNVALRVEPTADPDKFMVFGRGELHLGVLLENMRREGFEMAVSRPRVVIKQIDGVPHEPYEQVTVDADSDAQGAIMQALGSRGAELKDMQSDRGRVRLDYMIPSRGLIGFQTEFRTMTRGTGLLHHVFDHYGPVTKGELGQRPNGVLISNGQGVALAYSLFSLQERGRLCIGPNEEVYEGMIIGMNNRDDDLVVNPLKGKKLTNMRASGKDEAVVLSPPIRFSLEQAMEFIDDDELIEITPNYIRLRKRYLLEHERKRGGKAMADQLS
jgi:GTP-binding protein